MAQKTKKPDAAQCVIYARYSTLAQRDQSIEDQVAACERWATSHGLNVYDVYADRHISGTTDSRPAFQQMIQDAAQGAWPSMMKTGPTGQLLFVIVCYCALKLRSFSDIEALPDFIQQIAPTLRREPGQPQYLVP